MNIVFINLSGKLNSSAMYVFGFTNVGFVLSLALVSLLASWSIMLGKNLLVVFSGRNENNGNIDHGGFLALLFFLATVLGTILWYGYIYDSRGTVNPSWTGIFG
jgi:hypothetical protein